MKCPKCAYLGFDTGQRCRNCGYDFSLIVAPEPAAELSLRLEPDAAATGPSAVAPEPEPTMPPPSFRGEPVLPLFGASPGEDEPLIKVPSRPRPPLAVRRTPDTTRLRAVSKAIPRPAAEPELFRETPAEPVELPATLKPATAPGALRRETPAQLVASSAGARVLAAVLDHAILFTIDAAVIYLTLRIASLTMSEWTALPMLPMVAFLGLLKLAYFTAFTCVGGQTIGKMAAGIRVVADDNRPLDAPQAIHRALAGAVSFATFGAGFIPALIGSDHRALHDRLAHTRVVTLPTA